MCDAVDLGSYSFEEILTRRRGLRRKLSAREGLRPVRIAVLGGSTSSELVDLLELWLLDGGFAPVFHQSEYGRFYVDAVHDTQGLIEFAPDIVYVHTSVMNLQRFPSLQATDAEFDEYVQAELKRFDEIWTSLEEKLGCVVIQNNFEFPQHAILGNLDASSGGGHTRFVSELNREMTRAASGNPRLLLQDVCSIAARVGLLRWFDAERWFSFKLVTSPEGSHALAVSLAAMVRAIYGRVRKVLVLDLDDTVWGGVIGDDGADKILIGRETPVAEAYTAFQEYCLALRNRGVLLAACSKNDEATAKQGFEHPDSVLKLEHFAAFKANWEPKPGNLAAIAEELGLSTDSFVFVDDNPAERAIVAAQMPEIAVPDVGRDVARFAVMLEAGRYFEQVSFSSEDLARAAQYQENVERSAGATRFANYGEYLDSLEMSAEIDRFKPVYLERITQLTNKTNQFNLTTRRYTLAEIQAVQSDPSAIALYGKLHDRFGDNGLISIVLGRRVADVLEIDLWLMSCRVLKRDMETAMLDALVDRAREAGVETVRGFYLPTRKNRMVADHYARLGFRRIGELAEGGVVYELQVAGYAQRNRHIRVPQMALAAR